MKIGKIRTVEKSLILQYYRRCAEMYEAKLLKV
nr:MAG TPA: hypothetical protein [Caudoviricetes sp.]